jgi:hypothetical protein
MGRRDPSCGLGWTTLAGLGWVESQQGTIGGRVLGADGRSDPQDLDDSAWTAARYLCASGLDLRTAAGWAAAVRSYNHSDAYVRAVYDAAGTYAARTE